jgi:CRP/FNR family cyclic AMP-dependent transcriptional regulator
MSMHAISDNATFQNSLAALPLATYRAGETVLSAASTTGRLLILKQGAVTVVKEGVEIAKVTEPGAVFGELSTLLGQPHTADVHALQDSKFHVACTATPLMQDPIALLYVATLLARRLDSANRDLVELKREESRNRWKPPSPACHLALARCEAQRSIETSVRPDRDF